MDRVRRLSVRISGTVQGVGFRPYVHRLASTLSLAGRVGNDAAGVWVEIEGPQAALDSFVARVAAEAPPLADVRSVEVTGELAATGERGFTVALSTDDDAAAKSTALPPDTALCINCASELLDPSDRRYRHPFITCTDCGPRFTITESLPYDRPRTTMADFEMCAQCAAEYHDPADRRFHAQPVACHDCGPHLSYEGGTSAEREPALASAITDLRNGLTVAVKGLGGFHLACDPYSAEAVNRLRTRKQRGNKPFAVMVRDLEVARRIAALTTKEEHALASPQSPIVLVRPRPESAELARLVAPGNGRIGLLLPPTALHVLLLTAHPEVEAEPLDALVLTSGNLSDEPICIDNDEARERLAEVADSFLMHNRRIHLPCDDSVVRVNFSPAGERLQPVRRSRGYAPAPMQLPSAVAPTLAVGGELKTTICVAEGERAWLSQHIGDTGDYLTLALLDKVAHLLSSLQRVAPERYVADLHPGYLSRKWAEERAKAEGKQLVLVQHHHAHLASLLAEHLIAPSEPVLGVTFDGTGFGPDGSIWGGEFLLGNYEGFERVASLKPTPLPGGDAAVKRPARIALAQLFAAGLAWDPALPPVAACQGTEAQVVRRMLESGTSVVSTTSAGRLFDAVSALAGVAQDADYEGQAAIEFETVARQVARGIPLELPLSRGEGRWLLDSSELVRQVVAAVLAGAPGAEIAFGFHDALAEGVLQVALQIRTEQGVNKVGLTGGVFQNARLTRLVGQRLGSAGFEVLVHSKVPPNDGGLALGQVVAAEHQIGAR